MGPKSKEEIAKEMIEGWTASGSVDDAYIYIGFLEGDTLFLGYHGLKFSHITEYTWVEASNQFIRLMGRQI